MFKKLFLLIIGGAAAAGGFIYYTQMPKDQSDALVESLADQKVNIEKIAKDIINSDAVQVAIKKGTDKLMEAQQTQDWLGDMVKSYAQEFQGVEVTDEAAQEMVQALTKLRKFSQDALQNQADGVAAYTAEQQQRFDHLMEEGDEVFQRHLGIPMTEFLAKINKSSFQQVVNPDH